jgi:hypothetical protein
MPPRRLLTIACLLATLLLTAPLAASATGAGGTEKETASISVSMIPGTPNETAVPEPGAALVFGAGALVVAAALRRRSRRSAR